MAKETNFCYCCYQTKPVQDFELVHLESRLKPFCKKCYNTYPDQERKTRQIKYVFGIIKNMKEVND